MEKYQLDSTEFALWEKSCVPMAVYQFIDRRVVTIVLSAGFCTLFGIEKDEAYELMDNNMYRDTHPDDVVRIADAAFHFATEDCGYNVVYRTKVGDEYKIIHAYGEHVLTEDGTRLAVIWYSDEGIYDPELEKSDSELHQRFNRMMEQESNFHKNYFDHLTGLPAMTYFFELAVAARKRYSEEGKQMAILYLDMNGMKYYNGRYGFAEGDKLLKDVSKILVREFSNENCSRFAQDHFAVYTDADRLDERLDVLLRDVGKANEGNSLPLRIGIYVDDDKGVDISDACDRAKMACDLKKEIYSSAYHYYSADMLSVARNHQYILDHFEQAMQENRIKVYYQPIVRAANGRVCDEEALARWDDPELGFLSPAEFIPVLEEARLIYKLDLFVLDKILERINEQQKSGLFIVPLSINLSRYDFESCDIVEEIRSRVDAAGVSHDLITVEVTESVVGNNFEYMKRQIARFRDLGFAVWMDDFGSGYSSIDVLQTIRFDLIKFDLRFMRQFDQGEETKIILTELIKMVIALGLDMVMEGVETQEQVDFLREVGCRKLQGYFYCKPIPYEGILERYRTGVQIGFENPEESEYYSAIGGINLYDLAVVAHEDQESVQKYFDTIPMTVIEMDGDDFRIVRSNKAYRDFMRREYGISPDGLHVHYEKGRHERWFSVLSEIKKIADTGDRSFLTGQVDNGNTVHTFMRRIAVNPVTGTVATVLAILAIVEEKNQTDLSYAHVANALSTDYFALYYVNLETEHFTEYHSRTKTGNLAVERHGENFFSESRKDALSFLYEGDQEYFLANFTKENVIRNMDEHESFTLTYRLMMKGVPTYVNMKAVRMGEGSKYIIIGVNNVDDQMRQKAALEQMRQEQVAYSRIMALSGDFVCIYIVDPETNDYSEYSAASDFASLGLAKSGKNFFEQSLVHAKQAIYPDDLERFSSMFTKENVLGVIEKNGVFGVEYRLMLDGNPTYVNLNAAKTQERDGTKLIIGVINKDAQVRREQEYAHSLSLARAKSNRDTLTGVRNRTAFTDAEEQLDRQMDQDQPLEYAIVLFHVSTGEPGSEDAVLKTACSTICQVFKRSPVFRIGNDEFAVIAQGHDYDHIDELIAGMKEQAGEELAGQSGSVAIGMARYANDKDVMSVFERANASMNN